MSAGNRQGSADLRFILDHGAETMIVKYFHQISGKSFTIMGETPAARGFSTQNRHDVKAGYIVTADSR
jgi:hypothetical protein